MGMRPQQVFHLMSYQINLMTAGCLMMEEKRELKLFSTF